MPVAPPGLRRFFLLRLLRWGLLVGALYDLSFATLMAVAPRIPASWFHVPLPGEAFYLWLCAVLLAGMALMYLLAAHDPHRYSGNIVVAILARSMGFVALGWAAYGRPELAGLWIVAFADLGFAAVHAVSYLPLRE
ncbi:MAG: hypothetical protein ABI609_12055 [Acidobacteriota bacterium]